VAAAATTELAEVAAPDASCRLCGGATTARFSRPLSHGLVGEYRECGSCHMLQSRHLDGLDSRQLAGLYEEASETDTGAAWRDLNVLRRVRQLGWLGLLPRRGVALKVLDFGSGSAFAASVLRFRHGSTAVAYAPVGRRPTYRVDHVACDWSQAVARGPFDLVLATEVLEHLRAPREELTRLGVALDRDAVVYVTTGLFRPGVHGPEWAYLAPESGLHVSFYSNSAMAMAAKTAGCSVALRVGAESEWLWVSGAVAQSAVRRARARMAAAALRGLVGAGVVSRIQ
jgi:hypothetical protein